MSSPDYKLSTSVIASLLSGNFLGNCLLSFMFGLTIIGPITVYVITKAGTTLYRVSDVLICILRMNKIEIFNITNIT